MDGQNIMSGRNITLILVTLLTIRAAFKSSHSRNKLYELFTNWKWIINFLILILFSIYIYIETKNNNIKDKKVINDNNLTRDSLKKALFGFMIAIFAELGLTIAPFWIIFTTSYYLSGWI